MELILQVPEIHYKMGEIIKQTSMLGDLPGNQGKRNMGLFSKRTPEHLEAKLQEKELSAE